MPSGHCKPVLDRYVSFDGMDCDGRARRVMALIEQKMAEPGGEHPFLVYFMAKRRPPSGPLPDDLFLIHSNINQIREFFEACDDTGAIDMLMELEESCC